MLSKQLLILFLLLSVLAESGFGRPSIDKILMKNGDSFTCEIKKLDRGVLFASFDYVDGTVSISWEKVARVESTQLFLVKTAGGNIYTGALRTPEAPKDAPVSIEVV